MNTQSAPNESCVSLHGKFSLYDRAFVLESSLSEYAPWYLSPPFKESWCEQCDQIGRFLKVLGNKFSYKSSPSIRWPFGLFKAKKLIWPLLGQLWLRFGLLLFLHLVTLGVNQFNTHSRYAWLKICSRIPLSLKVYIWEVIYLPRHRH